MNIGHVYAGIDDVFDTEMDETIATSMLTRQILESVLFRHKTFNPMAIIVPDDIRFNRKDHYWTLINAINASSKSHDSIDPIDSAVVVFAGYIYEIHCRRCVEPVEGGCKS